MQRALEEMDGFDLEDEGGAEIKVALDTGGPYKAAPSPRGQDKPADSGKGRGRGKGKGRGRGGGGRGDAQGRGGGDRGRGRGRGGDQGRGRGRGGDGGRGRGRGRGRGGAADLSAEAAPYSPGGAAASTQPNPFHNAGVESFALQSDAATASAVSLSDRFERLQAANEAREGRGGGPKFTVTLSGGRGGGGRGRGRGGGGKSRRQRGRGGKDKGKQEVGQGKGPSVADLKGILDVPAAPAPASVPDE